jgi:hypothetical protein
VHDASMMCLHAEGKVMVPVLPILSALLFVFPVLLLEINYQRLGPLLPVTVLLLFGGGLP